MGWREMQRRGSGPLSTMIPMLHAEVLCCQAQRQRKALSADTKTPCQQKQSFACVLPLPAPPCFISE